MTRSTSTSSCASRAGPLPAAPRPPAAPRSRTGRPSSVTMRAACSPSMPRPARRTGSLVAGRTLTGPSRPRVARPSRHRSSRASRLLRPAGAAEWRLAVGGRHVYSSPAVYRGPVYFGTYGGTVYSVGATMGKIVRSRSHRAQSTGAVPLVAPIVCASSLGDRITGWDWCTGRELVQFQAGEYAPASGKSKRLLLHGHSRVLAVKPVGAA